MGDPIFITHFYEAYMIDEEAKAVQEVADNRYAYRKQQLKTFLY